MSLLKTFSRLIQRKRIKTRKKSERAYQKFLKRIAAGIAGLSFLATTNLALATTITAHDSDTLVQDEGGGKYKVLTGKTSGTNAFNSFSQFNLSSGHNVNLHLPAGTNNLINFVNSQIQIDGTLNAIKDNKIGGNLFFLSSQGLAIGSGGVVNCGAFFAMTPTQDFMDKFVKASSLQVAGNETAIGHITNRKFVNHNSVVSDDGIPINNDGSIVISGQINAIDNVALSSHEITIANGSSITTGITDFSGLVNTSNLPAGCQTAGLTMTSTDDGNIEIVAIADNKSKISNVSAYVADELTTFTKAKAEAKVTVNGTIDAKRDATIEAIAVNGELDDIDQNFYEYGENKPLEKYDSAKYLSNINATVEFGTTANVDAKRNLNVNAIARNFYSPSALNILDLGLSVLGMTSPINLSAEVAIADSKAEVLVKSGAALHAKEDVKITADSKVDISVGASTAIAKIKKTGGGLSAGAAYTDVNSEANVIIEGSVTAGEGGVTDKGNITIKAKSTNNMDVTGATKTANDNAFFALGAVVSNGSNNSKVEIKNTATVTAEKDIAITANTESDISTEAVAETGNSSHFGVAVNVTDFDSESLVKIYSSLNANNGNIDINSKNLILQYRSIARTTIGYTLIGQAIANAESNLVSGLFSRTSFTGKFTDNLGESAKNKFKAAGALLFNEGSNNSKINIGGDIKITADNEVNINSSSIVEDYYLQSVSKAVSKIDNPEGGAHSASAGVMSTDLEQNSTIQFADSTRTGDVCNNLISGKKVDISSLTKVEYNRIDRLIQGVKDAIEMLNGEVSGETWNGYITDLKNAWTEVENAFGAIGAEGLTSEKIVKDFMNALGSLPAVPGEVFDLIINGPTAVVRAAAKVVSNASDFLFYRNYINMYVSSAVKGENGDNSSSIGLAGAVGLSNFSSGSEVILGRNTKVETISPTEDNAISINASTDIENIGAAGHLIPSTSATSFGGTYYSQNFDSNSNIYVAEGSKLITNGKDAQIISHNTLNLTAIGVSSALAKGGIEGMISRQTGTGNAGVYFDDEAYLSARNSLFRVTDNTDIFNLAGAAMINSGVGAGVGVAITDYTKENLVNIGDIDKIYQDKIDEIAETDPDTTTNSLYSRVDGKVSVSEKINAEAKSTGDTTTIGVAGGVAKNDDSGDDGIVQRMTDKFDGKLQNISNSINSLSSKFGNNITNNINSQSNENGQHTNPSFSLSAAGSLGLNFVKNTTKVDISGATLELGALANSNLNAVAINSSEVKAFGGAAGIMFQTRKPDGPSSPGQKTVGIAGAIGMNDIENTTEAIIENSTINQADKVKVFAVDGGQNIGMGLGLQVALNSGTADGAYTIGSSVSVSSIQNDVNATFKDNNVNGTAGLKTDLNIAAYEGIKQVTGGVSVTVGQQKGAIGAAVNVNNVKNNLNATIEGGNYLNINNVQVSAMQALTQLNLALTTGIIGGTPNTCAIMGAMIYNQVDNKASAKIKDANFSTNGTVKVNSRDYKKGDAAVSDFEALLEPLDTEVDQFVSTKGEDYYDVDTSNDVDGTNAPIVDQELEGSLIVSGAIAGTVSDTALGAAVVINDLNNDFTSEIENSTITASAIEANASVNAKLISVAAGIAVSLNNGAGCGSVVYNDIDSTINAGFLRSDLTAGDIKGQALNGSNLNSIAGIISAGAGNASVGMAAACNDITNTTNAYSYATKLTGTNIADSEVLIDATNNSKILNIAAAFGLSAKVGIAGSVSVNEITDNTLAKMDDSYTDEDNTEHSLPGMTISNLYKTTVSAEDNAKITGLAGNVAGGGTCGLGGSVSNSKINGETGAYINNANLDSRDIVIDAYQNSVINSWAEGIGGGGNVAFQGAVSNTDLNRTVTTQLTNSDINNNLVDVAMESDSSGTVTSVAVAANGAGQAAVGAGVAVNRITDEVSSEVKESNLTLAGLSAKSTSGQVVKAVGVAGTIGGSAGVSGSVGYNRIRTTNNAFISDNSVINAQNNVGVIAQTDDVLINYGGLISIGGNAGIGAAFSGNTIEGDTKAYIKDSTVCALGISDNITTSSEVSDDAMNNAFIDDQSTNFDYRLVDQREDKTRTGLIVDSSSTHTMKSFVANAAAAGTVALSGTVGVNSIEGNTLAYIKNSNLNTGAGAGNVYIDASDYTNYSSFVGSVGGAGTVGIGAAVNTNKSNRTTSAYIEDINAGSKAKKLSVNATGKQGSSSIVAGLGAAGTVGVAGTVSTTNFSGETSATIDSTQISVDSAEVASKQFERSKVNNSTAGVAGYAGVGGAVAVTTDKHTVSSKIEDSSITMNTTGIGNITVDAKNETDLHTLSEAVGGGIVGVAGNVSVNNLENTVNAEINNSSIGNTGNRSGHIDIAAENDLTLNADLGSVGAGAVGAGCSVAVNSIDGKVRTQIDGSSLYAANAINISANENRTIDQKTFTVAAGGTAASLNVMWLSSGEVVSDDNEDGNQELHDAINAADEANQNTIDDDKDVLSDDEQANMNGVGGSLTADSAGKSATTIGIGDIFSGNSSTIDSAAGEVKISAKENTTATMKGGSGAVGATAAAGASVATLKTNRNLGVTIHDAVINAATNINIDAEVTGSSDLDMYQGTAGVFGGGTAAFGKVETTGNAITAVSDSNFSTGSGDIEIKAKDTSSSTSDSYGLTAGMIAAGTINSGIDNSGSTKINLSNNQFNADNNILIEAVKDNVVAANAIGGNIGIFFSGIGVNSYVNDTSDSAITMTGNTSTFTGNEITLKAKNSPEIDSNATSGAVSSLHSAGVSVSTVDIESKATVNVSGGNQFDSSKVNFIGEIDGDSDVEAEGVSGGLAGSFGYNESRSSNNAQVHVLIGDNTYNSLTDLVVLGKNIVNQTADTWGLNIGGILASGNNKAKLTSNTTTKVSLTGNTSTATNINSLDIKADSSSIHDIEADGNGGGLVSVDGLSAYAMNDIKSVTEAILTGKWKITETLNLFATQYDKVKINADSTKATLAGYSGTKTQNTIDSTTNVYFAENANIVSGDDMDFGAINTIGCNDEDSDPKYAAEGGGYGGIVVSGAKSIADITSKTEVKIGENASLYADGNISGDAKTIADVKNRVITKGAGLVANPYAKNDSDFEIENNVITESGSNVRTKNALQDISLAAAEQLDLKITADSDMQGGVGGAAIADTDYSMDKTNFIETHGDLYSTNDINLYTDADSDGVKNKYFLEASAYAYNKHSAVAIADAHLDSSTYQTNKILIESDSDLSAVRHVKLGANKNGGRVKMIEETGEYTWRGNDIDRNYASTASGEGSKNVVFASEVKVNGNITAGVQNKVHLTLDGIVDIEGKAENSSTEPTITSTIQEYEDQLKLGSIDYGNALFDRYQEVSDLADEYKGTDTGVGYTAEKERLLDEMKKYGLYDESKDAVISGYTVQYVELPSMVSSGGNVVIDTYRVRGDGTVKAQGSPEIIIENNTNLYTKVNDLNIVDYGGEIIYNDVSLGDTASDKFFTLSYVETNDSADSLISVNQNWNGTVQVKDSSDVIQNVTPLSSVEINGNVDNPLGRVEIFSAKGDIVIQGKTANDDASISGAEISLNASNGTIAQGFTEGIVNIGGTPEDIYNSYADTQEAIIDGHETSDTTKTNYGAVDKTAQSGTWIAGGSVYINASDINVNGLIQSGYAEYTISLSADAQAKINNFDASYDGSTITTDILTTKYKLNSGGAKLDGGIFKYEVQAFYNPQTKEIILEDIDPKGGKIYLTGRISSTGNGRIFAADGSADININNSTQNEIVLGKVNVGDLEGLIKITDTAKDLVTEFRRGTTTTYAIGSDIKNVSSVPGVIYTPKSDLFYNWSTGYNETNWEEWRKYKDFSWWGGWSKNSTTIHDWENSTNKTGGSNGTSNKLDGTYIGTVSGAGPAYTINYENDVGYHKEWFKRWVTYDNWTHFSGTQKYKWGESTGKEVTFQHSLNASNNIGIGFIGSTLGGSINVNSTKGINLNNNVTGTTNTQINLTTATGNITQHAGRIIGDNVSLTAATGIGSDGQINHRSLNDNLNYFSATTNSGNINLVSTSSIGKQGDLFIKAITDDGNVNIVNTGSLYQNAIDGTAKVKGDRIDLESQYGAIGALGVELKIEAGQSPTNSADTMSASLNAKARDGIYMNQLTGNMRVGKIESALGDVYLKVTNGDLLNVLPAENTSESKTNELIDKWVEMGIINPDGSDNGAQKKAEAILDYENGVKSEFENYKGQKEDYDNDPTLQKSDAYLDLESKYSSYASADAYLAAQDADSDSDYYKIKNNIYGWSKDQLLYAIQDSIINPTSGSSQTSEREANIKGKNIVLDVSNGGIGKDELAEEISLVGIGNNITDLKKIANSEASDVTWDEDNDKATIKRTTPIGIKITAVDGSLTATAQDNIYIAGATEDPIYVNNVNSTGGNNIRLLGKDGVYSTTVITGINNFSGKDLIIEGGNGAIGTTDRPILTDATGKFTARAEGLINIFQNTINALNVSAIYSGSNVTIQTLGDLFSVNTGIQAEDLGYINANGKLELISGGSIGEVGKGLRFLSDNIANIEATAINNLCLAGQSKSSTTSNLNLKFITPVAGTIEVISAATNLILDSLTSAVTAINLEGKSLIQNGAIATADLKVKTANGATLDHTDNLIAQANMTNTDSGDITLKSKSPVLVLKDIRNNAENGNVNITSEFAIGALDTSDITSKGYLTIAANSGIMVLNNLVSGADILLNTDYAVTFNNATAVGNFVSATTQLITHLGTLTAGGDVTLTSDLAVASNNFDVGGNLNITGQNIVINNAVADGNLNLNADQTITSTSKVEAGTDLNINAGELITLKDAIAGNNITLNSQNNAVTVASQVKAGNNVAIDGTFITLNNSYGKNFDLFANNGLITIYRLEATGNFIAKAVNGLFTAMSLYVDNDVSISARDGAFACNYIEGNNINIAAQNVGLVKAIADNDITIETTDGSAIFSSLYADNNVNININNGDGYAALINSGNDLTINSTGENLTLGMGNAKHDLTISANGSILKAGLLTALSNLDITAKSMQILSAMAGELGTITATNGDLLLVNGISNKDLTINAENGKLTAGSLITLNDLNVTAKEFTIGNALASGYKSDHMDFAIENDLVDTLLSEDFTFSDLNIDLSHFDQINQLDDIIAMIEDGYENAGIPETFSEESAREILNGYTGGNSMNLTALNGNANIGIAHAAGDLNVTTENGEVEIGSLNAGKTLSLTAKNSTVTAGAILSLENLNIIADSLDILYAMTGEAASLIAEAGDIKLVNGISNKDFTVEAKNGKVTAGSLITGNNLNVSGNELQIGNALASSYKQDYLDFTVQKEILQSVFDTELGLDSAMDVDVDAIKTKIEEEMTNVSVPEIFDEAMVDEILNGFSGDNSVNLIANSSNADIGVGYAAGDLKITANNGKVTAGNLNAGKDIKVNANSIDLTNSLSLENSYLTSSSIMDIVSAITGNDLILNSANGKVTGKNLVADNNLSITSSEGDIDITHAETKNGKADIKASGGSILIRQDVTSNATANLESDQGIIAEKITSNARATVKSSNGLIDIESITTNNSDADISITNTNGDIQLTTANAGRDIISNADNGIIEGSNTTAGHNINMSAADIISQNSTANNDIALSASGNINSNISNSGNNSNFVSTAGNINLTDAKANNNISIDANQTTDITKAEAKNNLSINGSSVEITQAISGSNLNVNANSSINAQSTAAGTNLTMTSNGNITADNTLAGTNLAMTATGNINTNISNAGNNSSFISTAGNINIINANTDNDISIDANQTADITKAEAKNNLSINGSRVEITQAISGSNLNVNANSSINAQSTAAGTNLTMTSNGNITADNTLAGKNLAMTATGNINTNISNAGNNSSFISTAGNINIINANTDNDISIDANQTADITKAEAKNNLSINGSRVEITQAISDSNLNVNANSSINAQSTAAGADLTMTSNGSINTNESNAGNDISLSATENIISNTANADRDISMITKNIDSTYANAGRDLMLTATNKIITDKLTAGNDAKLSATNSIESNVSNSGNNSSFVSSAGNIAITNANSSNDINIDAANTAIVTNAEADSNLSVKGTNVEIDKAKSGADLSIQSETDISLNGTTAGGNLAVNVSGNINGDKLTAGNSILLQATENIVSDNLKANLDISLNAQNINSKLAEAGRDITLTSSEKITSDKLIAGNDIKLLSDGDIKSNISAADNDSSFISTSGNISITDSKAENNTSFKAAETVTLTKAEAKNNLSVDGKNIELGQVKSGENLTILSGSSINLSDINTDGNLSVSATGDINGDNLTTGKSISLSASENILSDNLKAGLDISLNAQNINSKLANAGRDILLTATEKLVSDILIAGNNGLLKAAGDIESNKSATGNNSEFISTNGNINIKQANSDNSISFEAAKTVAVPNAQTKNNLFIKGENIEIDQVNAGANLVINSENSINLNGTTTDGNMSVTVNKGNINAKNVVVQGNIDLKTLFGDIVAENSKIESANGNVNLIAGDNGSINVHELLARKDISGLTESGEIMLAKINGQNVTLVVEHGQNAVDIDKANIGNSMKISADTVKIKEVAHTGNDSVLKLGFAGVDNGALNNVEVDEISSDIGTHVDGLWAKNAKLHSNTDYFYLKDVYLEDKGILSNNSLTISVYGRNPDLDGSDIVIFFTPTGSYKFTDISFQNALTEGGKQTFVIFHADKDLDITAKEIGNMDKISAEEQRNKVTLNSGGKQAFINFASPYVTNLISYSNENLIAGTPFHPLNESMSLQNNQIIYVSSTDEENEE